MDYAFLYDLVVVFGVAMLVVALFSRWRLPSLIGFLLTGAIVGPHQLELVHDKHSVELLAEVGVIVLLFTVGIEFSLGQLLRLGMALFQGLLQVVLTIAATAGVALALGMEPGPAVLVGCVVALSSTAIVMRLLVERAETATQHGRMALGILIFQDLAVVVMILAVPFLAGQAAGWEAIGFTLLKALGLIAGVLIVARKVVPPILRAVVGTRSRELFLLTIIVICLGTAWLTSQVGLSLGLGAFLAGLVISESEYSHHAFSATLPFQDAFSGLFFVSIGMLLDVGFVLSHLLAVLATTLGVLLGKAALIAGIALLTRGTLRIGVLSGLLIAQIGEFSFLLLHAGAQAKALSSTEHQLLMAVTVLTMGLTPLLVRLAPVIAQWTADHAPTGPAPEAPVEHKDHVIIIGFGINGRNVASALRHIDMRYVVLELNPKTVDSLRAEGEPALFGDATQSETLKHAGVDQARVVVITVPDAASARRIVQVTSMVNPGVHIIVRTRFVGEVAELYRLGAREVVPEEFETSIAIFSCVLRQYLVPGETIEKLVNETRQEGYRLLRTTREASQPAQSIESLLPDVRLEVFQVPEGSELAGRSIAEVDFKRRSGSLVLAVRRRSGGTIANPPATLRLEPLDAVLVMGAVADLRKARELVHSGRLSAERDEASGSGAG